MISMGSVEMMLCFAVICDLIGKTEQLVKKNSYILLCYLLLRVRMLQSKFEANPTFHL